MATRTAPEGERHLRRSTLKTALFNLRSDTNCWFRPWLIQTYTHNTLCILIF
ncbi:hypothetical protein HanXRQr2_Chr07g0314471 [Helianthus annuus]|uniref:Uncharacterized protein n=1 Tax=Helianthus annuus TaxID=4232 RepID=A0A9K3IPC4_HELAN|nr:hypothetical protein HanXRQr2_Chr07g0314471 [Helianthus annuus]